MECGIALGSNSGDRHQHLCTAYSALRALGAITAASPIYETPPIDCPEGSGPFLNAVLTIESHHSPAALLTALREIEQHCGRPAEHAFHAPRTLDLDLLFVGTLELTAPALTIPHPRLHLRRFVLQPLASIRPALILPGQHSTIAQLLATLTDPSLPIWGHFPP